MATLSKNLSFSKYFVNYLPLVIQKKLPKEIVVKKISLVESRRLNREYRGKDKPTDVLSFFYPALFVSSPPASPELQRGERKRGSRIKKNLDSRIRGNDKHIETYGEILTCPEVIKREAKEQGNTQEFQMTWMIVHGMIHLAGVHHEKSSIAEKKVGEIERKILSKLFLEKKV